MKTEIITVNIHTNEAQVQKIPTHRSQRQRKASHETFSSYFKKELWPILEMLAIAFVLAYAIAGFVLSHQFEKGKYIETSEIPEMISIQDVDPETGLVVLNINGEINEYYYETR